MRIQNNVSYILHIFEKFYNLYNEIVKTYNKEINKMLENH